MGDDRNTLKGSARPAIPEASLVGAVPDDEPITATLVLRRRAEPESVGGQPPMTRDELAERYGADPADIQSVRSALEAAGIAVEHVDPGSRRIRIRGSAAAINTLFAITLLRSRLPDGGAGRQFRHHADDVSLPSGLAGAVTAVLGLDDRPQARAHLKHAAAGAVSYTPLQVGEIYQLPADTDGSGQRLAIIELGGGYDTGDLQKYFDSLGVPLPTITAASVDGATNDPGKDTNSDGEVMLDIEVAGALAPGAAFTVYFAPNTDAGFLDAIAQASHDSPAPTAISISWGQSEDQWSEQSRTAMDEALADAALLGVTVAVAAGDDGSSDRQQDGAPHVDFPASSPHALGCGGTTLHSATDEVVWNNGSSGGATGGGVSDAFPLPEWQADVGVPARAGNNGDTGGVDNPQAAGGTLSDGDAASGPGSGDPGSGDPGSGDPGSGDPGGGAASGAGRGVPDVAGDADPQTGYQVLVSGQQAVYGGTSAVAPLWAALVCRLAQGLGRPLGLLQTSVYADVTAGSTPQGFRDITEGNNGAYTAGPGWDACTGLGVPIGTDLLELLRTTTVRS